MPLADNLTRIAKVLKSNGTAGEVIMSFPEWDPEEIKKNGPVFIFFDGLPVPFFIESIQPRGNVKAVVKLSGIDTFEDSEEIVGQAVYGDSGIYGSQDEESLDALVGWTVKDEKGLVVGEIVDYEDIPGNPCVWLETPDGEVMMPLHDDLIISADPHTFEIIMSIPEGLL